MSDIIITKLPTYPGNNLNTDIYSYGQAYNIQIGQSVKGCPFGISVQKFVHAFENYQYIWCCDPVAPPYYIREKIDGIWLHWIEIDRNPFFNYREPYYSKIDNKKRIMEEQSANRTIEFDGDNLVFQVDNVIVRNGELPQEFNLDGLYYINRDSIAKLIVALYDDVECVKKIKSHPYKFEAEISYTVYHKGVWEDKTSKLHLDELSSLKREVELLEKEKETLRVEKGSEEYKRYLLEQYISEHNKLPWWNRLFGIDYKRKLAQDCNHLDR